MFGSKGRIRRTTATGIVAIAALCAAATGAQASTLFAGNQTPGSISAFTVSTSGTFTPVPGSPFTTTQQPRGLVGSPDGSRLYSGHRDAHVVSQHVIGANGSIASLGPDLPFSPTGTGFTAVSPDGRYLYVTSTLNNGGLQYFAIGANGSLSPAGTTPISSNGGGLALTPDGKYLYVCSSTQGLYAFSIGASGAPTLVPGFPQLSKGCGDAAVSPDGRFFISVEPGWGVRVYAIAASGELTQVGDSVTAGAGPNGVVISPDGKQVYVHNVGNGASSASVTQVNLAADGSPSAFGTDIPLNVPAIFGGGIAISPDGRYVVGATNVATSNIIVLATNGGGQLTAVPGTPVSSGASMAGGAPLEELTFRTNQGPTVAGVSSSGAGRTRTFTAIGATDSDGSVASYVWTFGNGTTLTTATPDIKYTYPKGGIYTVSVNVIDNELCGATDVYDGRQYLCNASTSPSASLAVDTLPPAFSKLKFTKKKVKRGGKATLGYTLSEAATVKVTFQLKKGKKYKSRGSLTFKSKSGKRSKKLTLKIKRKKLPIGKYRVLVTGSDGAKNTSTAKTLRLTIRK